MYELERVQVFFFFFFIVKSAGYVWMIGYLQDTLFNKLFAKS